jgi:hypothetical protein
LTFIGHKEQPPRAKQLRGAAGEVGAGPRIEVFRILQAFKNIFLAMWLAAWPVISNSHILPFWITGVLLWTVKKMGLQFGFRIGAPIYLVVSFALFFILN